MLFSEREGKIGQSRGTWISLLIILILLVLVGGKAKGRECGFAPSLGQNRVLIILINFSDTSPTYTPEQIAAAFFGAEPGSFRHILQEFSYHQFDVTGEVVGWFTASNTANFYGNDQYGQGSARVYPHNLHGLAAEAVDLAEASGVDFSLYDNSGDGCVDSLVILHQGQGGERIRVPQYIWSTVAALSDGGGLARNYDRVWIDSFIIVPEVSYKGDRMVEGGVPAHEYCHLLGLIDLYDKDGSSRGFGIYELMSSGVWGGDFQSPERPVHLSAYSKIKLGWLTPLLVSGSTQGRFVLPAVENLPVALKIPADPETPAEYFLVENREWTGYDQLLPSRGLLISHVDERGIFENRDELIGCGDKMPQLAVEQADGQYDLERYVNWGDSTDLFPRPDGLGREFHATTTPNSLNHQCLLSGVAITQIGDPGDTVSLVARTDDFRPVSSMPELFLKEVSWEEREGDGDAHLEAGEDFLPWITLTNNGATARELRATLSSDSPFLLLGNTVLTFPDLGPGKTVYPLNSVHLTVLPGFRNGLPANLRIGLVYSGGATNLVHSFRLGQPDLLYVDDDGGAFTERNVGYCLKEEGYFFDQWETKELGDPDLADLLSYSRLLWVTGRVDIAPLSPNEMNAISGFLEAGGKLVLSSPYLLLEPTAGATTFAREYLKVASFQDDHYALDYLTGIANDPVSHDQNSFLFKPSLFHFPGFNRTIGLTPMSGAAGCMLNDRSHYTALRFPANPPGPYQSLFLSFGLENIYRSELGRVLKRALNHFAYRPDKPYAISLAPNSGRPKQVNLLMELMGLNLTPDTDFIFPDGEITITEKTYLLPTFYRIKVNVSANASPGWHDLVAIAADGSTIRSENLFRVNGPPLTNKTPVAEAGEDQSVSHGATVILNGQASRDPDSDPITFVWQQLEGPLVSLLPGNTAPVVSFRPRPDYLGSYVFQLTVFDPWASDSDTVRIIATNQPPVAVQGPDLTGTVGQIFALDGTASWDADHDPLIYLWTQLAGDSVTLNLSDPARPTFLATVPGNYVFSLKCFDSFELSLNEDTAEIIVTSADNHLPQANAGPDQITSWWDPNPVQLDGTMSFDEDGDTLYYHWTLLQKPSGSSAELSDPTSPQPSFVDDRVGQYVIGLRVYDGEVWSFQDTVIVTCEAQDNDNDGIPDFLDPDDDNDLMPDTYELAHGLNPMNPADGNPDLVNSLTDPDGDHNPAVHEYFNHSDPQLADAHTCDQALGGCFFGDSNANFILEPVDCVNLQQALLGLPLGLSRVYPRNGHTLELNGNGSLDPPDLAELQARLLMIVPQVGGAPAQMTLLAPGFTVSASLGDTLRVSVQVLDDPLKSDGESTPRAGAAVLFQPLSNSARILAGEGSLPPRYGLTTLTELNSSAHETVFSLTADEKEIVIASDREGGQGGFDLYLATRTDLNQNFGPLQPLTALNTETDEASPALSPDGLTLYFARKNPGSWDLYFVTRPDRNSPFSSPQPISELNTDNYEYGPSITEDGLVLYFGRWTSSSGYNLWRATRNSTTQPFNPPQEVSELNSPYYENLPTVKPDNKKIYFLSNRPASRTGYNLWFAERESTQEPFSPPVELAFVNTNRTETQAWESPDGYRLYYSSYNFTDGADLDLYLVRRPSLALPFFVSQYAGRYEVTGSMEAGPEIDSAGRAQVVIQPLACGVFTLAVWAQEDRFRGYPPFSLPALLQVTIACP